MLGKFWEVAGGKLAERWAGISAHALVFWVAGLAAWTYHHGGLSALAAPSDWLGQQKPAVQALTVLALLVAVVTSGAAVDSVTGQALRLLAGYWPTWAGRLRRRRVRTRLRRADSDKAPWQQAQARVRASDMSADDLAAYAVLERRRRRCPSTAAYFMPTVTGNILRAAERRPADKYGLDAVVVWPHLWLLLPETAQAELRAAMKALNTAVRAAIWGVAFCSFTVLTWYALPVGLAVVLIAACVVIPARAQAFGEVFEAAFDLYRVALYHQLRWPLPANPEQESTVGRQLTTYLWRGSDRPMPSFTSPST
ncbi:hypothetical protein ABZW44_42150 [Streptomyces mirabilis]|uniref:hypothetical protein n=1 Tax=Streptomyces mirabilis TaxID=68239 RepID=UPI0033A64039